MSSKRIEFNGHNDAKLSARLELPNSPVRAVALMAHCFTCSKDIPAARRIASKLASFGIATLRFDFTGLGHSEGEFANTNFSSNVQDIVLAAEHLSSLDMAPQLLIGHSLGGAAIIKAAGQINSARAVVTIGAPADPSHVTHNFANHLDKINQQGSAKVTLAGREFEIQKQFIDDIKLQSLSESLTTLKRALLVLHAPLDQTVSIDNAAQLFSAAKHPKSFVTLDNADHLVSRAEDADYLAEVILAWSKRYLVLAQPQTNNAPEGVVRVSEASNKGFKQDITVDGQHQLVADEPESYGGTNQGPSPYQLVSSGLGACTTMTLRMYAQRKKWPLDHVYVDVTHNKRHIDACNECDAEALEKPIKKDIFTREITLIGNLTQAQKEQLLAIADKCPVHKTLHGQAVIETRLS
ncbi:MAG: bifunctional alpha/beta hydrolase/OsmC family protein [Gammaproteobacteria bacterium]|nr:bifunctional alpha/beta hydrolase/OsmC family protein [Gammaproteobacteria bacterium]